MHRNETRQLEVMRRKHLKTMDLPYVGIEYKKGKKKYICRVNEAYILTLFTFDIEVTILFKGPRQWSETFYLGLGFLFRPHYVIRGFLQKKNGVSNGLVSYEQ